MDRSSLSAPEAPVAEELRIRAMARLNELAADLLDMHDVGGFLQKITDSIHDLFGFERVSVSALDVVKGYFTIYALAGYSEKDAAALQSEYDLFTKDAVLEDFREEFRVSRTCYYIPAEKQKSSVESFAAVRDHEGADKPREGPGYWHELDLLYFALVDKKGEITGYLQVDYPKDWRVPSKEVVSLVELFAGFASVGLENSKLFKSASVLLKENELKTESVLKILELARSVLRIDDPRAVLKKVAAAMASTFGYAKASVSLFSDESEQVVAEALVGYSEEEQAILKKSKILKDKILEDFREEFRVTNSGYFIPGESQLSHPEDFVYVANPERIRQPRPAPDMWHELDLLYFGIYDRTGRLLGFIQLDYPIDNKVPIKETMEAMEAYASIASIAIENSSLFEGTNEARKQVKMYLDLLTHDVGNLVNPINAYLELVLGTTQLDTLQYKYISSALEATKSIGHLIRNVRKSAQMLEEQQLALVPRDLLKSLTQVSTDAKSAFLSRKLNVRLNFPKGEVWVMADALLDEVFYNLLTNSIKFDEHDEVVIDVNVDSTDLSGKKFARVKVVDRGIGIPDDLKDRVFVRGFKQAQKADTSQVSKSKGAGMGLSLVRALVDRYSGKVWVENRVYADHSMGSVFIVLLPMP